MKRSSKKKAVKTYYIFYCLTFIFTILFVLFVVFINSKIEAMLNVPKIVIKEKEHNFGHVSEGDELQYKFKYTNEGEAVLKIAKVQTSCGCTGATVGEKTEYKKNESGEIKINFNTQGRNGHQEKTISVFSNDPKSPQDDLKIIVEID